MSIKPALPRKYALVILRYRSCPAVSQICSLICLSSLLEGKGCTLVERVEVKWNVRKSIKLREHCERVQSYTSVKYDVIGGRARKNKSLMYKERKCNYGMRIRMCIEIASQKSGKDTALKYNAIRKLSHLLLVNKESVLYVRGDASVMLSYAQLHE